jgi:eukaryotic-like serine/threonine-protein kinase
LALESGASPRDHAPDELVGQVLQATYRVTRRLARGGMGAVYAAEHVRLPNKRYAIKVLLPAARREVKRFRQEAEVTSGLGHLHIVDVQDFNETPGGQQYMVMELLEGEDMGRRLDRVGRLEADEVTALVRQVGSALQAAHDHDVVHRDMKPANIFLVDQEDGSTWAKVLDFGISKVKHDRTPLTGENALLGTARYMSPEQANSCAEAIDARTDIFALGTICYQSLSGQLPFDAPTIPGVVYRVRYSPHVPLVDLVPGMPAAVDEVLDRALAKKRERRYERVIDFAEDLAQALDGVEPGELRPPSGRGTLLGVAPTPSVDLDDSGTLELSGSAAPDLRDASPQASTPARQPGRRPLLVGGLALLGAAAVGGFFTLRHVTSSRGVSTDAGVTARRAVLDAARAPTTAVGAVAALRPDAGSVPREELAASTTPAAPRTGRLPARSPTPGPRLPVAPEQDAPLLDASALAPVTPDAGAPDQSGRSRARKGFDRVDEPQPPTGKGFDDL